MKGGWGRTKSTLPSVCLPSYRITSVVDLSFFRSGYPNVNSNGIYLLYLKTWVSYLLTSSSVSPFFLFLFGRFRVFPLLYVVRLLLVHQVTLRCPDY